MQRTLVGMIAAGAVAFASLSVACSDDPAAGPGPSQPSNEGGPGPGPGPGPSPDGGPGPNPDGGDAGCTFAGYVIDLVTTQTTSSSQPDPSLGQQCAETTTQAAFAPLFP
jgi:hypothetical protein